MIGIYKITSPSGKVYIGQSTNIEQRWKDYKETRRCQRQTILYNSFKKYGVKNHKFEIIEECNESKLLERETYWKKFYKVLEIPSLCCRMDGKGGRDSQETKDRKSKARKGKSYKHKFPLIEYDFMGNFKKIWENYIELPNNRDIKKICLKESFIRINNSLWRFKINDTFPLKLELPMDYVIKLNKLIPIIQYDLKDNPIKEYKNNTEVINLFLKPLGKEKSGSSIHACCKNKQYKAFGFKWKYKM